MHFISYFFALVTFVPFRRAVNTKCAQQVVHETAPRLGPRWALQSKPSPGEPISLVVALAHPHERYLSHAYKISDPESSAYGEHLSAEQLVQALPDYTQNAKAVQTWLTSVGIYDVKEEGEWIKFTTTVDQADTLFNANFSRYTLDGSETHLLTLAYGIPCELIEQIDFLYPTVHFMDLTTRKHRKTKRAFARPHLPPFSINCKNSVCPSEIRNLYNINYVPPDKTSGSRIGIGGFLEQYINKTDVAQFLTKYGFENRSLPYDFSIKTAKNGRNDQSQPGVEASLDVEYAAVFTDPLEVTYYSIPGRPPTYKQPGNKPVPAKKSQNEPYITFLNYLASAQSPPQVLSISYSDSESTVPEKYARRVCNMYGRLALRGVSVIHASGDGGATGALPNSECRSPTGKGHSFEPTFPSSCHWVTSVGATKAIDPPYAASYSSGGFSNYFSIPKFQKSVVPTYQNSLRKPEGFYNITGRGIPDVSLVGDFYAVRAGGFDQQASGTSAATPVFAAMVALINDRRLRSGKSPLGYLNPVLYSNKLRKVFADVRQGSSAGCSYDENGKSVTVRGYRARLGWDAVTGLGSPDFQKLMAALL